MTDQAQSANPANLVLPETLNEVDLLGAIPDPSMLLGAGLNLDGVDAHIVWGTQMIGDNSIDSRTSLSIPRALDNDDLDLELGDDDLEIGREAAGADWRDEFGSTEISKFQDDDLGLDLGDEDAGFGATGADIDMTDLPGGMDDTITGIQARGRRGSSPLSDLRASEERALEKNFNDTSLYEPPSEMALRRATNRVKRRKVIEADALTEIPGNEIRSLQQDRTRILKPSSFLPRDPLLLALLNMQRSGGFISSILGDGRASAWAPELRDVISVEIVRRSGDLKRKRDSGIADMYIDENALEIPQDDESMAKAGTGFDGSGLIEDLPAVDDFPNFDDTDAMGFNADQTDQFDQTTVPILHPQDAGPISQGTKHAVHLLRNHFSESGQALESPSQRTNASVQFSELLPRKTTKRSEATRMFFEVLVLATKDAIKVEQKVNDVGGEIRVRPKRGLWGEWAEMGASGQIEEEIAGQVEVAA
jgi:cohesin complex subunit SCC1